MALVDQVKRKLNITWSDEVTDARVSDIMASVQATLSHKLGITDADFDFSVAGMGNMLYLSMCLYEWNHTLQDFDANYHNEIAQCRAKIAVESEDEQDET